jgi:hypothetical protein
MGAAFNMNRYDIRAGIGESINIVIRILYHQVYVKRKTCKSSDAFNNRRPQRYIRYKMAVHYINMYDIGSRFIKPGNFLTKL